jgi:FkbM family methyltransferase
MKVNTHVLFSAILQAAHADCVCDIGSRDGEDAIQFRTLFPNGRILAFEANKYNFSRMVADPRLADARVEVLPFAITSEDGRATFHITDVDYSNPNENRGTSSLLSGGDYEVKEAVSVETRRLDRLVSELNPAVRGVGLWIDVEGAEYGVIEGIEGIKDRVIAIHVETSVRPLRDGQRTMADLTRLLDQLGFDLSASGFEESNVWGDAVYIRKDVRKALGWRHGFFKFKSGVSAALRVGHLAVFLKNRFPALYRMAYKVYHRAGV